MYSLKIINNKEEWNKFIISGNFEFYSFLSSWEWGEFKNTEGFEVFRYGIYKRDILVGILPLIKVTAKRGNYLFAPHTPLIKNKNNYFKVLGEIIKELKNIAKKEKCNFIRLNSPVQNTLENRAFYKKLGFLNAPMHEHAEDTHLLNLDKTQEELLQNMKKKDRYYINRAKKEGVKVRIDNKEDHIDTLIAMHHSHAIKVGYHKFSRNYILDLYKTFGDNISTISTSYNNTVESILMTIRFGETCVYYVAASSIINKNFSPNYLCQFEAIKKARKNGCKTYNFWGVSPDNNPKHPIAGVTVFKRKFGGYDYSLLHAQDLVVSPKYWINWIIETIRRKKRGYYYKKPV